MLNIFSCTCWPSLCLWKHIYSGLLPILKNQVGCFFVTELYDSLDINPLSAIPFANIFSCSEFQKNIYFCFIDYAKAFDCVDHNKLWKILKEMGIPDHLIHLLRNPYAGQEATVRTGHGTTDWFQIGKWVCKGCILSPCLCNLYAEYIMRNAGLEEAQAGIKIAGRNTNNLRWHNPYGRKWRTKKPLGESERGEWKSWLKTQHSEN